uniref:DHHA2 domain-containing protein n=1 Tax=Phytophthora ramorum TaxID=164328 RepID=H3GU60_PHYRM
MSRTSCIPWRADSDAARRSSVFAFNEFLRTTRSSLFSSPVSVHVLVGNEAADADSIVSALSYAFVHHQKQAQTLHVALLPITRSELVLRCDVSALFQELGVDTDALVFVDEFPWALHARVKVTLMDHNALRATGTSVAASTASSSTGAATAATGASTASIAASGTGATGTASTTGTSATGSTATGASTSMAASTAGSSALTTGSAATTGSSSSAMASSSTVDSSASGPSTTSSSSSSLKGSAASASASGSSGATQVSSAVGVATVAVFAVGAYFL